jgi:pimeloyl-ACP methyl ester carboxylesterase
MHSPTMGEIISADGTRIVFLDQGRGHPIVIVHGGSSHADSWAAVASRLAARYRVLSIERRLYGRSGPPQSPHSMAREAEDVAALFGALPEPPLLVGHSSGAIVALEAALLTPPAGLFLYEPPLAVDEPLGGQALVRAQAALARGQRIKAMGIHLRELVQLPPFQVFTFTTLMRLFPRRLQAFIEAIPGQIADDQGIEDLGVGIDRYAAIRAPAVLLGGDRSPAHLRRRLEALGQVLPSVHRVVRLPEEGHTANLGDPAAVAAAIEDLAAALWR